MQSVSVLVFRSICGALLGFGLLLGSCTDDPVTTSKAGTYGGDTVAMGNGKVRSWIKHDDNGNPSVVGITFGETALQNLPTDSMGKEYMMMMPSQASATGINHVGFDWNPFGHEPKGIYDAPHFDIHFYYISNTVRMSIPFGKDSGVAAKYLPANYITDSISIPMMGIHCVDVTSPEFHGKPFDKTFIYGFSKGQLAFLEPMITKAFIESKTNVETTIPQPAEWQTKGRYYPSKYSVSYDATNKEYTISLSGFALR